MKKLAVFLAAAMALGGAALIHYASGFEASMVPAGSPLSVTEYKIAFGLLGCVMLAPVWIWPLISLATRMLFRKPQRH